MWPIEIHLLLLAWLLDSLTAGGTEWTTSNNFFKEPIYFRRMLNTIKLDGSPQPCCVLSCVEEKIILTSARIRDNSVRSLWAPVRVGRFEGEEMVWIKFLICSFLGWLPDKTCCFWGCYSNLTLRFPDCCVMHVSGRDGFTNRTSAQCSFLISVSYPDPVWSSHQQNKSEIVALANKAINCLHYTRL